MNASRNQTEVKDNHVRSVFYLSVFFGGDVLLGSTLARLSDKFLKTELLNKNAKKNILNKIIPLTRKLEELTGRSMTIGAVLFWINLAILSVAIGLGLPKSLK